MEAADLPWQHLGSLLINRGLLTVDQVKQAFEEQTLTGRRLGEIVVGHNWVSSTDLAKALADQAGLEYVDLSETEPDPEAATLLQKDLAFRYQAFPVRFVGDDLLLVAVADPSDVGRADDLRLALGHNVRLAVADPGDLERTIKKLYRTQIEVEEVGAELEGLFDTNAQREDILEASDDTPAVKLVHATLAQCIEDGASDVHFEPQHKQMVVRARVDGVTRHLLAIPKNMQAGVISRLKVMGGLDIAERRLPQDGRVTVRVGGIPMDLRVAIVPTTHGEQIVLRIFQRGMRRFDLSELGMSDAAAAQFARAVRQPYGGVIVCGPTGSGKTTTLYAAVDALNDDGRVLQTIEDPVEYQIDGVNQVEVNPRAGLTFARGLRAILRADPDVILVGEIRDEETAKIAAQAALTGHLVLSSLHAHSAASSIERLKNMGVEPGLLATSLNVVVGQRLARRLCMSCREPYAAPAEELSALGREFAHVELYRAKGCVECTNTGYSGRVALYEVMAIDGKLRRLMDASTEEIFSTAVAEGMTTMRDEGVRLCLEGISSFDEIRRVTGDRLA